MFHAGFELTDETIDRVRHHAYAVAEAIGQVPMETLGSRGSDHTDTALTMAVMGAVLLIEASKELDVDVTALFESLVDATEGGLFDLTDDEFIAAGFKS